MPYAFTWVGGHAGDPTDGTDPYNWNTDKPAPPPGAAAPAGVGGGGGSGGKYWIPSTGDDVTWDGSVSSTDCDFSSTAFNTTFGSVGIVNNYPGTVTHFTFGASTLSITSGTFNPSVKTGEVVTAINAFTWTGGTINATTRAGNTITVEGTDTIGTAGGAALTSGDTLNFYCPSTSTSTNAALQVDLNLTNQAEIEVGGVAGVAAPDGPNNGPGLADLNVSGDVSDLSNPKLGNITISTGGVITVYNAGTRQLAKPIAVSGGKLFVSKGATLDVTGALSGSNSNVDMSSGAIVISDGSTLFADKQITTTGGEIATTEFGGTGNSATIAVPNLVNSGADVALNITAASSHDGGVLNCTGNVNWTGGTYRPVIDVTAADPKCDVWKCAGTFTVGAGAKLAPGTLNGPPAKGATYLFLQSNTIIVGNPPAVDSPLVSYGVLVDAGPTPKNWYFQAK